MIGLLWAASALAKPPAPVAYDTPTHVNFWRDKVDWDVAQHEAVARLAEYITIDTALPAGNEARGVAFLAGALEQEDIETRVIEHGEGRSSLIARIEGLGVETPLCLVHHVDTVGFDETAWSNAYARGPLSGAQAEDHVWGRGALDAKGLGTLELMTMVWLARLDVPLLRDVVLLAVADGEGAKAGAKQLAAMWSEIGCSHVINEGSVGVMGKMFEGQAVHAITAAEKGVLWVDVHADGPGGVGAVPSADQAPVRLQQAIAALAEYQPKPALADHTRTLLYRMGDHEGGSAGKALKSDFMIKMMAWEKLKSDPEIAATMVDTVLLTGVRGAEAPDVVPERLTATYDCRLLPGTSPEEHLERMKKLTNGIEGLTFEVLYQSPSNGSSTDDRLFTVISHYATEGRAHAVAGPTLTPGYTDSLLYRPSGAKAFGYVPFEVSAELAATVHGPDERVPVSQVREGLIRLFSMVVDFAGNP